MGSVWDRGFGFFSLLVGCEPMTSVSPIAQPNHQAFLTDSPPEGSQESSFPPPTPGISQADSPCSCLLFFLIKVTRARIPSQKVQPRVWMSSFWLCHWCARLRWKMYAGPHGAQWEDEQGGPDQLQLSPHALPLALSPPASHKPSPLPNLTRHAARPSADAKQLFRAGRLAVALD